MGSFYFPSDSWLHRTAAGVKLLLLMLAGAGLMWVHDWRVLLLVLLGVLLLVQQSGARLQQVWLHLKTLIWLVIILVLYTSFAQTPLIALEVGLRIYTLLIGALLVSMTTQIAQMMEVLIWMLRPFHQLGWVNSERVALVFGLTLRLIPELTVQWQDICEAQAARGLKANPFTMGVPMLLRTLRRAQDIADALDTRL